MKKNGFKWAKELNVVLLKSMHSIVCWAQACVLSTLLYGSESWTLYTRQERRLNTFHLCCLRRILGISWQDHIPNTEVLARAGTLSMYALLTERRLRWFGHVTHMHDGRLPKDILYGELATGSRPTGRPTLLYKRAQAGPQGGWHCARRLWSAGSGPQRFAIHYQVSYQDSRVEERGAVGKESSQAPESRDRYSTLGRQRLHMQQL